MYCSTFISRISSEKQTFFLLLSKCYISNYTKVWR